jgi:hypothetical protein
MLLGEGGAYPCGVSSRPYEHETNLKKTLTNALAFLYVGSGRLKKSFITSTQGRRRNGYSGLQRAPAVRRQRVTTTDAIQCQFLKKNYFIWSIQAFGEHDNQ